MLWKCNGTALCGCCTGYLWLWFQHLGMILEESSIKILAGLFYVQLWIKLFHHINSLICIHCVVGLVQSHQYIGCTHLSITVQQGFHTNQGTNRTPCFVVLGYILRECVVGNSDGAGEDSEGDFFIILIQSLAELSHETIRPPAFFDSLQWLFFTPVVSCLLRWYFRGIFLGQWFPSQGLW